MQNPALMTTTLPMMKLPRRILLRMISLEKWRLSNKNHMAKNLAIPWSEVIKCVANIVREMLETADSAVCDGVKGEPPKEELLEAGRTENHAELEDGSVDEGDEETKVEYVGKKQMSAANTRAQVEVIKQNISLESIFPD